MSLFCAFSFLSLLMVFLAQSLPSFLLEYDSKKVDQLIVFLRSSNERQVSIVEMFQKYLLV